MITTTRSIVFVAIVLTSCSLPIAQGDKTTEERLKRLQPVPDKTSLYVCRVDDPAFQSRSTVFVDDRPIAALAPKTFAHMVIDPGTHRVHLVNESRVQRTLKMGELSIQAKAGEIVYVWVGVTGGGWGVLTSDHFSSVKEAQACIAAASYAVLPP